MVSVEFGEDGSLIKRFGELGVFGEDTVEKEHGLIVVAVVHEFDCATEEKVVMSGAGSVGNGREGVQGDSYDEGVVVMEEVGELGNLVGGSGQAQTNDGDFDSVGVGV